MQQQPLNEHTEKRVVYKKKKDNLDYSEEKFIKQVGELQPSDGHGEQASFKMDFSTLNACSLITEDKLKNHNIHGESPEL